MNNLSRRKGLKLKVTDPVCISSQVFLIIFWEVFMPTDADTYSEHKGPAGCILFYRSILLIHFLAEMYVYLM